MSFHPPADGRWAMQPRLFRIGNTTLLDDDPNPWTVKAVTANFAVLTRLDDPEWENGDDDPEDGPTSNDCDVLYTVLDCRNGYRGPCNLSGWGYGDGTYSEADCAAMLADFEAGDLEISHRNWTRIRFADEAAVR
ncbi:hypothetical protein ACWT_5876 [Actinoplanes sp. SE50]|uniref:hypothetical protein n=1 Tax=unclassified Actinoplanes TaxID=2626549 RepID=UPI00023EBDE0|nr:MULTISPECIES: hypothetical protein [unclassified Actinoplanes]AEV86894.1 hypothetical protein ACPL_6007 [Actinoplanes sp. SE50/110]ATO85291.1 hypothetical protein ACWT_5876 [Actinoplanes sp. SE50]SLM02701.1 hypothetical protein ACSP50_5983 [Actinoplanes sp. SE50/110]